MKIINKMKLEKKKEKKNRKYKQLIKLKIIIDK